MDNFVFIVTTGEYSDYHIYCVFRTKDEAITFLRSKKWSSWNRPMLEGYKFGDTNCEESLYIEWQNE